MLNFPGYTITERIHVGDKFSIYRAQRHADELPVYLKTLNDEHPDLRDVAQLQREFELIQSLDSPEVIKVYGLEKSHHHLALAMEEIQGGQSLSGYLKQNKLDLETFLRMAIQLSNALMNLHQAQIIHKDIKPSNIIVANSGELKLIDFGISTRLTRENPEVTFNNVLEGSLPYMSPEQTGRVNRALDYRSDFYALGVTFYEMLTGHLPFKAEADEDWIMFHVSRAPERPSEVDVTIPKIVSDVIMKLLEKRAEYRYQSAFSLKVDLQNCLSQWLGQGNVDGFQLGGKDISERFRVSSELYGREEELEALLNTFAKVSQGNTEYMLISGYSGVGKSSLVGEINRPIVEKRGFFVSGKCDQFQRHMPYSALTQAFDKLLARMLSATAARVFNIFKRRSEVGFMDVIQEKIRRIFHLLNQ